MRVVIHLPSPVPAFQPSPQQLDALVARAGVHEVVTVWSETELIAALSSAEAVVVWSFAEAWYARAPRLAHVFTPAAGRESIASDPSGRVERHFGTFHGAIMAESLLGMVAFMNRRFGVALEAQRARRWERGPYSPTRRLCGQLVLIIGYGAIGQHCGRVLSALGMVVHALRRDVTRPSPHADRVFSPDQLHEALPLADHVACVLPGDASTDHLLDSAALGRLRPSACVYNIGRGNAIDIDALCSALAAARLAGAFLDVLPEEPPPAASPVWNAPNLYLTPHASAINAEYLDLYFEELASALRALP